MKTTTRKNHYRSTESKYKGGAQEMYVTYDMKQETRGGGSASYPKVKRVYIAGDVKDWNLGTVKKKSGREVRGVQIEYEQSRTRYQRTGYAAKRGKTAYKVAPASVASSSQRFVQVVEVPEDARNVHFYKGHARLPAKYKSALQDVR
jgi:hypothetical protein